MLRSLFCVRTCARRPLPAWPQLPAAGVVSPHARIRALCAQPAQKATEAAAEAAPDPEKAAGSAVAEAADDPGGEGGDAVEPEVDPLDELQARVDEKHDQLLRSIAETDNVRKRAATEQQNASKYAVSKFAKSLLDVADNLSRAMESVPEDLRSSDEHAELRGLYDGVQMTETVLLKAFGEHGASPTGPRRAGRQPCVSMMIISNQDLC
jgi:molecular chaperone GrpE (heat shock protein)